MTDIITMLYLLLCLYTGGPAVADPSLAQNVYSEYQLNGFEAAVEKLQESTSEGITNNSTADINKASIITDKPAKKKPAKPDYKKELSKLGYYREESKDNRLNLRNAVLRFQSSCNLSVSGTWDDNCLKALFKVLSGSSAFEDNIISPPNQGTWITVNKSRRILTLYKGTSVLKKYPIAIGNPPALTPEGKYTIVSKVINPAWGGGGYAKPIKGGLPANPLGYRWLGLSYKTGDDLGIHGNNSPYSIGKNISHGCIRMINSDVEELFEIVPKSTKVWIGSETTLKSWGVEQRSLAST